MYIRGRGKMGYLTSEKKAPAVDDPNYAIWDAENSMHKSFGECKSNVFDLGNQSQIFELTLKLGEIQQGEDNVTKYFNSFEASGKTLTSSNTYEWKSAEDGLHHTKKTMEDNRIFKFLAGLNVEFDEKGPGVAIEGSALVTTGGGCNKAAAFQRKSDERPRIWCDFCTNLAILHLLALLKSNLTSGTSSVSLAHTGPELGKKIGSARMINETILSLWFIQGKKPLEEVKTSRSSQHMVNRKALGNGSLNVSGNPPSIPTHIHASSSSVTDLSLPSHFGPSPKISAPEPGLGSAPIVPAQDLDLDLPIALRKGTQACTKHPLPNISPIKSLYGLKQSPRAWFERFGKVIKHYGYTQSQADHTIFYKHSNEGPGGIKILSGMEFARSKEGIFVNQQKYILDLLMRQSILKLFTDSKVSKGDTRWQLGYVASKKQNVVARSSVEAEFRAVAHGICEIMWIRRLLEELKMTSSSPMKLYCDNKAAISVAHNPVLHDRTKHVEVDKHFIKEKIDNRLVCMTYIPTEEQVAMSSPKDYTRGNSIF
ncbi:Copia protein [Vitis vinifera]|uniref:Copia protein n=1 Tax=Vitis vinifera TaxID=29760 RepID=A0A438BNT7_VITVI|nr:Copia protein [Vitis vinifera]